jgi:heme exporter protein B
MLPVLLLPVLAPMVMAAVEGTALVLTPESNEGLGAWIRLLVGFDIVFVVAGFLLYGFVLEE